jgi:hypothetical protein
MMSLLSCRCRLEWSLKVIKVIVAKDGAGHWPSFNMVWNKDFCLRLVEIDGLWGEGDMAVMTAGCADAGTENLSLVLNKTAFAIVRGVY